MDDRILEFWNSQAESHGTSHDASWGDEYAIRLEIENISQYIKQGDEVLDVGCANGFSTFHHLGRNIKSIIGVDFSQAMIREAEKAKDAKGNPVNIKFEIGDVRSLRFSDDTFDVVYTTRTLINLPSWDQQKQGIRECLRVCKHGGLVIFSEAFWEPLVLLNAMRTLKSLPPLVEHDFNRYIKMKLLTDFLTSQGLQFTIVDFSSIYYLGTRFLRELVLDAGTGSGYSTPINRIFYDIEQEFSGGGFGIQQACVVEKKS